MSSGPVTQHVNAKPEGAPLEMTVRSVALGLTVGTVLTAAITYLALYSGVAISAAIPAAVICTGVIRVAMKRATILENNLAQSIASAGEALAVGVVFTMPALVFAGVREELGYWEITLVGVLGGLLGVLFMIPLRHTLTMESPELHYPESVASAKIVQAGDKRQQSLLPMALAVVGGAIFKTMVSIVQVISSTVEGAIRVAGTVFYAGTDMSLALVGVGAIVGFEYSASMALGGVLSWLVAIPLTASAASPDLVSVAWDTWSSDVRFIGVGAMIVGAFWSIVETRGVIGRGIRRAFLSLRQAPDETLGRTQRDLPMRGVLAAIGLIAVSAFFLMRSATGSDLIGLASTLVVITMVFAFAAVSSYTVGLVGNSNNPASALAICAFLIACLVFFALTLPGDARLTTAVLLVAAFVCTATATAGDTAQRLKTGAILGGTPRRQQLAQIIGVVAFALVVAPIVVLLQKGYGLGTGEPDSLQAPQAVLFANLADMVFGRGRLPETMLWIGAASAVAVIVIDGVFRLAGTRLRLYVMPVAIGMYLPLSLTVPMFLGALLPGVLQRVTRRQSPDIREAAQDRAMLLYAGLITGEALIGVSVAIPRSLGFDVPVHVIDSPVLSLTIFALVIGSIIYFSSPAVARRKWRRS